MFPVELGVCLRRLFFALSQEGLLGIVLLDFFWANPRFLGLEKIRYCAKWTKWSRDMKEKVRVWMGPV